jgi:hypothetical protein
MRLAVSANRCQIPAGAVATALSVLSSRASLFSASLEPLTPPLRSARRDTGFPAAASCLARSRACSADDDSARGPGPEVRRAATRSRTEGPLAAAGGPGTTGSSAAAWSSLDPAWSSGDQDADR